MIYGSSDDHLRQSKPHPTSRQQSVDRQKHDKEYIHQIDPYRSSSTQGIVSSYDIVAFKVHRTSFWGHQGS